jgi:RNA-binding protein PNO1
MVVTHTQPSSSTVLTANNAFEQPIKKNRRKMAKKAPRVASENTLDDADMEESTAPHPLPPSLDPAAVDNADDDVMIDVDVNAAHIVPGAPVFAPLPAHALQTTLKSESRRIAMPPHRMTPLKKDWINIFGPLTEILGLQVRMNVQRRAVEIRVSKYMNESTHNRCSVICRLQNTQKTLVLCRRVLTLSRHLHLDSMSMYVVC